MILRALVLATCATLAVADYGKFRKPKVIIKEAGPSVQYNWVGYTYHYPKGLPDPHMRLSWNPLTDPQYKASWVPHKKGSGGFKGGKHASKGLPHGFGPPKGSSLVSGGYDSHHSGSHDIHHSVPTVPDHAPLPLESYSGPSIPAAPLNTYSEPSFPAAAPLNTYSEPAIPAAPLNTYSEPAIPAAPINTYSEPFAPLDTYSANAIPAAPAQSYAGPAAQPLNIIGPVAPSFVHSSSLLQQDQGLSIYNNQPTIVNVKGTDNVQVPLNAYIGPGSVSSVPVTLESYSNTNQGHVGQAPALNYASPSFGPSFGVDPRAAAHSHNQRPAPPIIPLVRPPISEPLPLENEGAILTNSIAFDGTTYSNVKRDTN